MAVVHDQVEERREGETQGWAGVRLPLRLHTLGTKSSLLPRPSCRVMLCPYTPSSSVCVLPPKSFLSSSSFNAVSMYIESFRVSSLITLFTTRHTGNVSRSQRNLRLEGYIHTYPRSTILLRAERRTILRLQHTSCKSRPIYYEVSCFHQWHICDRRCLQTIYSCHVYTPN